MKTTIRFFLLLASLSVSVSPKAQAVSPPPDGGYPGGNTAEGQNALQSTTSGGFNSAVGFFSLFANTTGNFNTAVGAGSLDLNTANNNTATGAAALLLNTTGSNNTANGTDALVFNNTGIQNTATGAFALYGNTTGGGNIAVGYQAGSSLTTGNNNIEIGSTGVAAESNTIRIGDPATHTAIFLAGITAMSPAPPNQAVLVDPATGQLGSAEVFGVIITNPENTAVGDHALVSNTGGSNTATGFRTLFSNTSGNQNTATGAHALFENIHGTTNTAVGYEALQNSDSSGNAFANANTAVGAQALQSNVDGDSNNAVGYQALGNNTDGAENNAMGYQALLNSGGAANTAVGDSTFMNSTTGSFNTIVGWQAGTGSGVDGNDNVYIGATSGPASGSESGSIRIGDPDFITGCWIAGIAGQAAPGGVPVLISADGKLGTLVSSARFKENIKPMDKASEVLLALKPVTFRYKKDIDPEGLSQFGLVAEDVEKVNPDLVVRDKDGKPYTVRYEAVNAMLLNEFLKEHRKVEQQDRKLEQQEATIAKQQKQIDALTMGLHKVSAQLATASPSLGGLEASKFATERIRRGGTAPQVVSNP